ncbi:MAG: alpha/beta hydrolase [Thermodesulfobacteriota bacterium]|nr:alpha/beta hydrolase [Thermodesulfobacteriota bacterium]
MPYFKTKDGCSIYYETQAFESSKPVVAFLNGTMQNTVYWRTHCMALKDRFRVLMYDARSQGKSDLGEGKLSLEGHTEDFSALLKHLRVEKAHLIGLSHGAQVALACAVHSPECVDRLVLCSVSARQTCRARLILKSWLEILKRSDLETLAWVSLPVAFGENFLNQKQRILENIVNAMVRRNKKKALIAHLEAMTVYPSLSQIAQNVHSPVLVLSGSDDLLVTEAGAEQLSMLLGGRYNHLTGIGHSIPAEAPELFNKTVLQFLDRT